MLATSPCDPAIEINNELIKQNFCKIRQDQVESIGCLHVWTNYCIYRGSTSMLQLVDLLEEDDLFVFCLLSFSAHLIAVKRLIVSQQNIPAVSI